MSSQSGSAEHNARKSATPTSKSRQEEALRRYRELVDEKYLRGLTVAEQTEMDALGQEIDGSYDEFYKPMLTHLHGHA